MGLLRQQTRPNGVQLLRRGKDHYPVSEEGEALLTLYSSNGVSARGGGPSF